MFIYYLRGHSLRELFLRIITNIRGTIHHRITEKKKINGELGRRKNVILYK